MPLLIVVSLIGIGFAVHAMKTGRPQFWMYILIFVPLAGSLAYVLFEILPGLAQTRRARRVAGNIGDIIDPDREWHRRREAAERTDSADTKRALAEECERKGMWNEAIALYETAATGVFADDPALLTGLARAQLGAGKPAEAEATLNRLRAAHPNIQNQDAHLIYARAVEEQGRLDEAVGEYAALSRYYAGLEARTRFGLLLLRRGNLAKARELFEDVIRAASARAVLVSAEDREWVKVAKANL